MLKINNGRIKRDEFELNNINIEIEKGKLTAIVGKNSSGKSSLLYTMIGTIPLIEGTIEKESAKIAFVGTDFPFNKRFDAEQIADLHATINHSLDIKKFFGYLERFKIPKRKRVRELSTGQEKLIALSLALASDNNLLLLDEINLNIDAYNKFVFKDLFTEYISNADRSIVVSSNQLESLEASVDNIIYLKNGKIAYSGSVLDLLDSYRLWTGSKEDFKVLKENTEVISYLEKEFHHEALIKDSDLGEKTSLIKILKYLEKGL